MTRTQWIKEATPYITKPALLDKAPTWIIELAARYGRLASAKGLRTEKEFRMYKLTTSLAVAEVKEISEVWKYMVVRDIEESRARKKKPEQEAPNMETAAKRPTASSIVVGLLRENPVRTDAQIIAAVNAGTFHDGFNRAQLAWYKGKFKKGELKGQNGVGEVIHEEAEGHRSGRVTTDTGPVTV